MISCIVPGSAQAFNFKEKLHLTEEEVSALQRLFSSAGLHADYNFNTWVFCASQALEVSDHFPVEVDLKPKPRYLIHNEL